MRNGTVGSKATILTRAKGGSSLPWRAMSFIAIAALVVVVFALGTVVTTARAALDNDHPPIVQSDIGFRTSVNGVTNALRIDNRFSTAAARSGGSGQDHNQSGMHHYPWCTTLKSSLPGDKATFRDAFGVSLNFFAKGRGSSSFNEKCDSVGHVRVQTIEKLPAPGGDMVYLWGLNDRVPDPKFGQSGNVRWSDLNHGSSPPSFGTRCDENNCEKNGKYNSLESYTVTVRPKSIPRRMSHPDANRLVVFDTYANYGTQASWKLYGSAKGHAPMVWSWINVKGGGIVRAHLQDGATFTPAANMPAYQFESWAAPGSCHGKTGASEWGLKNEAGAACALRIHGPNGSKVLEPHKRLNGWVRIRYGRVANGEKSIYGWIVTEHRYLDEPNSPWIHHVEGPLPEFQDERLAINGQPPLNSMAVAAGVWSDGDGSDDDFYYDDADGTSLEPEAAPPPDTTPPDTAIDSGPGADPANSIITTRTPQFAFSATDDPTVVSYRCSIDNGTEFSCSTPYTLGSLLDGEHQFTARAVDPAGNPDPTPAARTFIVDATPPETTLSQPQNAPTVKGVGEFRATGNVDGVGGDDAVSIDIVGNLSVSLGGSNMSAPIDWHASIDTRITSIDVKDVTGEGRADVVATYGDGSWQVAASSGADFAAPSTPWLVDDDSTLSTRLLGDVNNDGRADAVLFDKTTGGWRVGKSNGTSFDAPTTWMSNKGVGSDIQLLGDVNRDNRADLVYVIDGDWYVGVSTGTMFENPTLWRHDFTDNTYGAALADVTGDGRDDALGYKPSDATWYVARSTGKSFTGARDNDQAWISSFGAGSRMKGLGDFDDDGKADALSYFISNGGEYQVAKSTGKSFTVTRGVNFTAERAFNVNSPDPLARYQCSLDSGVWSDCTSLFETPPLALGGHTVSARGIDQIGNVDPTPATVQFDIGTAVDTIAPEVSIDGGIADASSTRDLTQAFTFSSNEPGSTFECQVDSGLKLPCSSPFTTPKFSNGQHAFAVTAIDPAGNADLSPARRAFLVDPDPVIRVNFQPAAFSPRIDGYLVDSGLRYASRNNGYTYGWNSYGLTEPWATDRNNLNPDQRYDTFVDASSSGTSRTAYWEIDVPYGNYRVHVVAGEPLAYDWMAHHVFNIEEKPAIDSIPSPTHPWSEATVSTHVFDGKLTISQGSAANWNKIAYVEITPISGDAIAPTVSMVSPTEGQSINGSSIAISFVGDEPAGYQCKLDSNAASPCGSDSLSQLCSNGFAWPGVIGGVSRIPAFCSTSKIFNSVSPGAHTATIIATDRSGNVGSTSVNFSVSTPGALHYNFQPAELPAHLGYTTDSGQSFALNSAVPRYGWSSTVSSNATTPIATDQNNPLSPDQRYDSFIDMSGADDHRGDLRWDLQLPFGTYEVHVVQGDPSELNSAYKLDVEGKRIIEGLPSSASRWISGTVTVTVSDGFLTLTQPANSRNNKINYIDITPVADTVAPTVNVASPAEGDDLASSSVIMDFTADEPASLECRIDNGAASACNMQRAYNNLSNGAHIFSVVAIDSAGNTSTTTRSFTVNTLHGYKINFQPSTSPKIPGYEIDSGAAYGDRQNGLAYGWASYNSGALPTAFDRDAPDDASQLLDSFVDLTSSDQYSHDASWEMAVPYGTYQVHLGVGDGNVSSGSRYSFAVEGKTAIDAVPNASNRWFDSTVVIDVFDGRLSLTQGAAAVANKLDFIEISPVSTDTAAPVVRIESPANGQNVKGLTIAMGFSVNEPATANCQLDGGTVAPCGADGQSQLCSNKAYQYLTFFLTATNPTRCSAMKTFENLSLGPHTLSVSATDQNGNVGTASVSIDVVVAEAIHINFQPAASPTDPGYFVDSGTMLSIFSYGTGGGYIYGWSSTGSHTWSTPNAYDRNSAAALERRHYTFIDMSGSDDLQRDLQWDIMLPYGTYQVHVEEGDPLNLNAIYKLDVEGRRVVDGIPTPENPWVEGTTTVTVSDGLLTLTQPEGSRNNKPNFIDITPVSDNAPPVVSIDSPSEAENLGGASAAISFSSNEVGTFACSLDGATATECSSTKVYPGLSVGAHSVVVSATDPAGNSSSTTRTFSVGTMQPILVNFQPEASEPEPGYSIDSGAAFGDRGNGLRYGWIYVPDRTMVPVDRDSKLSDDQKHDTFIPFADSAGSTWVRWEMAIPDGTYHVKLVAGDPADTSRSYRLDVENIKALDGVPADDSPWVEGEIDVAVNDGRLTLTAERSALNPVISYLEITPEIDTVPPRVNITTPVESESLNQSTVAMSFYADEPAEFLCTIDGGVASACGPNVLSDGYGRITKVFRALSTGSHTATVTATDGSGNVSVVTRTFNVSGATEWHFNFQPASQPMVPGYVSDSGKPWAQQGGGWKFGWSTIDPFSAPAYYHGSMFSDDMRNWSFVMMTNYSWEVEVPNGTYRVHAVLGDSQSSDGVFKVDAEGQRLVDGRATATSRWAAGTRTVSVRDGRLTLSSAPGALNNSLNYVDIVQVADTIAPDVAITAPLESANINHSSVAVTFASSEPATFECKLDSGSFAPCAGDTTYGGLLWSQASVQVYDNLALGDHTAFVKATDEAGNTSLTPRAFTIEMQPTRIRFQPSSQNLGKTPGYLMDFGDLYGDRGNGFNYGWTRFSYTQVPQMTSRNSARSIDWRYDTFAGIGSVGVGQQGLSWDIDMPRGLYRVRLVAGDATPSDFSSVLKLDVEGVHVIDGQPTAENRWVERVRDIAVTDGKLTITQREGAINNKINFVDITPLNVDRIAPGTNLVGPTGLIAYNSAAVSFTSTEQGSTFECALDPAPLDSCESPIALTGISDGPHVFSVVATDASGNSQEYPTSIAFTVDTTAPDTTISSGPMDGASVNTTTATYGLTSSEAGTFECKVDNGVFEACSSPVTTTTLSAGSHSLAVRAKDNAGNYDASPVVRTVIVDTMPPETSILSGPSDAAIQSAAAVTFGFSSTESGTFECSVDSGAFVGCASPFATAVLSDGAHAFQVRAKDAAGNHDATPDARTFTVDSTAPTVAISAPGGTVSTQTPQLLFIVSDVNGISSAVCSIDGGTGFACTSGQSLPSVGHGTHNIAITVRDPANNSASAGASYNVSIVDVTPPTAPSNVAASGITQTSANITWTASTDNVGIVSYDIYQNGSRIGPTTPTPTSYTMTGLTCNTTYTTDILSLDAANNYGVSPTVSFTTSACGNPIPVVTISSPTANQALAGTTASIAFAATNAPTGYTCKLDAAAATSCTSPITYASLAQGGHMVIVTASNAAGSGSATVNFTIDTALPNTTISSGPADASSQTTTTATYGFTSTESGTFECKVDSGSYTACTTPFTTATLAVGVHTFYVRAKDAAGNYDASPAQRTLEVTTPVPVVTISSPTPNQILAGTSVSASFTATNSPTSFTCKLDTAAPSSCTSPANASGLAQGGHTLVVTASNAAGSGGTTVNFTIDTVLPNTTINSGPGNASSQTTTTATYGFTSTESGTFECKVDSGSYTACTTPFTTATLAVGVHTFYVRAKDAAGNYDASPAQRTLTVTSSGPDTTPPTAPTSVAASGITQTSANISWTASTDNVGIASYDIYQNGSWIDWMIPTPTSYTMMGLTCNTTYSTFIVALDAVNNYNWSSTIYFTTTPC